MILDMPGVNPSMFEGLSEDEAKKLLNDTILGFSENTALYTMKLYFKEKFGYFPKHETRIWQGPS